MYYADFNASNRTDFSFRNRLQPLHHKTSSLIEQLKKADGSPLIDMILHFPTSDPLHLLDEGVMKKCLRMWMKGCSVDKKKKWSSEIIAFLNSQILQWNKELPSDFNRKIRTLQYISFYKATEFRTILLYIGMVAFKDTLERKEYLHFMYLCTAIRFYSCNYYLQDDNFRKIARRFLNIYCKSFSGIYGKNEVVSNIHNIHHIADDVERFGSLYGISTYPFENFLHEIKLRVKPSNNPTEQITRRLIEQEKVEKFNLNIIKYEIAPELKYAFKPKNSISFFYKFIRIRPNVFFSIKKSADRWFITKKNDIVEMIFAMKKTNSYFIFGAPIKAKIDFFSDPYSSHRTDIFLSDGEQNEPKLYNVLEIKAKMMRISHDEKYVFIPLLHSLDECLNVNV